MLEPTLPKAWVKGLKVTFKFHWFKLSVLIRVKNKFLKLRTGSLVVFKIKLKLVFDSLETSYAILSNRVSRSQQQN